MAEGWREARLAEICRFQAGDAFGKNEQGRTSGGHPFIKVSDMNLAGNELYIQRANNWVSDEEARSRYRLHPKDSVVFAKIGIALTYNRRRRLVRPTIIDNNMMSAVPEKSVDSTWFYYLLLTIDFNEISSGSALPYLTVKDLSQIAVSIPRASEQVAIASILSALDDKIELNRRMNEALETLARAIFKSWFVDFDPVRVKAEGSKPFDMDDATAALFAARFGPDGLPEGWREGPPLELARIISGGTPKTTEPDYWDGNIAWATAKDVSHCSATFIIKTERSISELGLDNSNARIVPARSTVVVARGATTGRYCMFGVDLAMNQTCYALQARDGDHYFLFCWFSDLVRRLVHAGHGSVFNTITTGTFETARTLIPPRSVRKAFDEKVRSLFEMILVNTNQTETLAGLRDLLLPKLISGEIRVKNAEQAVDGAV
jgi:type I restriction enzyme S subunit